MSMYELDDIVEPYDDVSDADKIVLKLGSQAEQNEREALEPRYSEAVRRLRNASNREAEINEYLLRGEHPPEHS